MGQSIIEIRNLSKKFTIQHEAGPRGRYISLRDVIADKFKSRSNNKSLLTREDFWALKDISFDVKQGDRIGIIGRNGAGKSTLLKVLSQITEPTSGSVRVKGRVASLLEVGTGFHPELTGRENIFLNGAILGMSRTEIRKKFDEIVGFAEVERFLDTPVKRYSSGMYVRLAFAIAAHLESEILIVDEVLAVGDAQFQKKAIGKMRDISNTKERTILIVSHNMHSISDLTDTSILLSQGVIKGVGSTDEILRLYSNEWKTDSLDYTSVNTSASTQIRRVWIESTRNGNMQVHGTPFAVNVEIENLRELKGAAVSIQIKNELGINILLLPLFGKEIEFCDKIGIYILRCYLPACKLFVGNYHLTVHFAEGNGYNKIETIENICPFEVLIERERVYPWQKSESVYIEDFNWEISYLMS